MATKDSILKYIPNGNRFSDFYGYGFGTGFIFLLSGAYLE
jgi:hypothetical protein